MAQEGSAYGTGLSPWHRKAVSMAQEDIPMAKEGCSHGTGKQSPWHKRAVPMVQEISLHATGRHRHGRVEIPAISGNHQRTHTDMPWQGFDFALQITRPPEGDRRCRPLSEGRHTNC